MFVADENRYSKMKYRRLGNSGLKLPLMSLGMWLNFGAVNDYDKCKEIILAAFNNG
ncbi:TPA: L-glyceraldehyde 3-phosphate reductase, partial [bacterium]|nr:L-glyceraldehyde 3-phosphate reductase [bacterium]